VSGWQLLALWAMSALGVFAIPAYCVGWWNGRRCLRAVLDATRLPPVVVHEVRTVSPDTAPTMPLSRCPEPPLLWSEQRVALDAIGREVDQMIAATERLPRWAR
jgi:hypothetical protein